MPIHPEHQQPHDDNDIDELVSKAFEAADDSEREENIALWEPAALEPHDIHALYRQLQRYRDSYEQQLEDTSVTLIRPFERLCEHVARYCEYQGDDTLEIQELRIEITHQRYHLIQLVVGPSFASREGLFPEFVGYSNPDRAQRYEELVRQRIDKVVHQLGQLEVDNFEAAKQWEELLKKISLPEQQFEELKGLISERLAKLRSELSAEQVIAVIKDSYDELDARLDIPARNIVETVIYNNLLRDLVEDFG